MGRVYLSGPWLLDVEGNGEVTRGRKQRAELAAHIAEQAGIIYTDEIRRTVESTARELGMGTDEAMENLIGALQYLAVRTAGRTIHVVDSISEPKAPKEKVNWKKEGF